MMMAMESSSQKIAELKSELSKINQRIAEREKTVASTKDRVEASTVELNRINGNLEAMWLYFRSAYAATVRCAYPYRGSTSQDLQVRLMTLEEFSSYKNANPEPGEAQMVAELRSQLSLNTEEYDGINRKMDTKADVIAHLEAELAWKEKRLASLEEMLASAESVKKHLESEIIRKDQIMEELEEAVDKYLEVANNIKAALAELGPPIRFSSALTSHKV